MDYNKKERLYLLTESIDGVEYEYPFGSLDFLGWQTLEWVNGNYIEDIKDRVIDVLPVYPTLTDARRIKSIKVERSALYPIVDFVTYISKIEVTYDKAIDPALLADFDHEDTWRIIENSASRKDEIVRKRTVTKRYFEYLDNRKKYDSNINTGSTDAAGAGQ